VEPFSTKDAVTLAIACVGAVLGIVNTWKALDKDRPKLRVVPKQAFLVGPAAQLDPRTRLCIEVTNLSTFPLTVTEVGVLFNGTASRGALINHTLSNGSTLPQRLEPRTSVTVYAHPNALAGNPHRVRCAYASTDCGLRFTGKSGALEQLASNRAG
jgi:hypothetical protein